MVSFTLIVVSWDPDDITLKAECAHLIGILAAGIAGILICIFVFPVWAGEDLHVDTADNIDRLARYLEAFGDAYFQESHDDGIEALKDYKSVLEYKGKEDSLVNFARWELRHKKFRCCHPWDQYLVIGSATRECAYKIEVLNNYLVSDVQTPLELRMKIRDLCTEISFECGLALKEVAAGLRTMKSSLYSEMHIADAKAATETLKGILKTGFWHHDEFLDALPAVAVASLLIDTVTCAAKIIDSVEVLSTEAKLEKPDPALTAAVEL
ncbi:aluminum-activated malate transporter 2-like [Salvia splendens]|uniref:aluminum-activated malate transporter 2-like n=1 Tax=Salvia splendens TaxID=180675 RepID=UPI001C26E8BF|nr:aluminum-activated malate transporter 2-like [Salvia splendens]